MFDPGMLGTILGPGVGTDTRVLGIDIGGANIKAATSDGDCATIPFAMWLKPDELADSLVTLAERMGAVSAWAITMTGEMADAYYDRSVGVRRIARQTRMAADRATVPEIAFYGVDGRFMELAEVFECPDPCASANWHALAHWLAGHIDSSALLIDVGSTTTDIIPIRPGRVATESRTDFDRLLAGELVYLGGGRTPVCSLIDSAPYRGHRVPVMREVFATTDDCALVLGWTAEDPADRMTSDSMPRTESAALNRLARMIGLDHRGLDVDDARAIAREVMGVAAAKIADSIGRQSAEFLPHRILSGHTADYFLPPADRDPSAMRIDRLADLVGDGLSRVAPAFACACLRSRELGRGGVGRR
jgi:probable H4MPT-linked C1 transfer pathway protein